MEKCDLYVLRDEEEQGRERQLEQLEARQETQQLQQAVTRPARNFKSQTSIEKQVAMEEATVSGLLSTLNEEAKEDIMLEEISSAREKGETRVSRPGEQPETEVIYLSQPSPLTMSR